MEIIKESLLNTEPLILFQILTFLDRFLQHEDRLASPILPDEVKVIGSWDLTTANPFEAESFRLSHPALFKTFHASGISINTNERAQVQLEWLETTQLLTNQEIWELIRGCEAALDNLSTDLPKLATWFETIAQTSLTKALDVVVELLPCLTFEQISSLKEVKMKPVELWNAEAFGFSLTDAGLLPAYTGFCTMFNDRVITMPNFQQWGAGSECVTYKQRHLNENDIKSIGRLYYVMFLNCSRAPCHELMHCLQHVCGQV